MICKFKAAVVAAFVFGPASAALAEEHFDVNIYRPGGQSAAFTIYHGAPGAVAGSTRDTGAYAHVPMHGTKGRVR